MSSTNETKNIRPEEPATMAGAQHVPVQAQGPNIDASGTTPTQEAGPPPIVPFKERVIGVAKKTRGTLLGKPELKEQGEKILQGEASIHDEPQSSV
ncbi:hypothetical protein B0H10DRAFT_2437529 [Mycena sp. CBHHK59/15]|nr:hypothetical protein B0H10DRAFT_1288855 [Mycena sp. CBHHK59/15]KAJ6611445.1 hypothetical protein B0H10DRAFT_2437529 [Mycena sp. CBHHK59/15]